MVSMLIEEYSAMDLMASQCRGDSVASNTQQVCSAKPAGDTSSTAQLLILPAEMLRHILSFMGAKELVTLAATCKSLGARASPRQHSYCEAAAMDQYQGSLTHYGLQDGPCMEERGLRSPYYALLLEEVGTDFELAAYHKNVVFERSGAGPSVLKLDGMGPKLLVSQLTTADAEVLRWRLRVTGNTAVEFGIIPTGLQDQANALHKRLSLKVGEEKVNGTGFSSHLTVGSQLLVKLPIGKGTVVEVVAKRSGHLDVFLYINPGVCKMLEWDGPRTKPMNYEGPPYYHLTCTFSTAVPMHLALTLWAHSAFEILHPHGELPPAPPPQAQQAEGAAPAEGAAAAAAGEGAAEQGEAQVDAVPPAQDQEPMHAAQAGVDAGANAAGGAHLDAGEDDGADALQGADAAGAVAAPAQGLGVQLQELLHAAWAAGGDAVGPPAPAAGVVAGLPAAQASGAQPAAAAASGGSGISDGPAGAASASAALSTPPAAAGQGQDAAGVLQDARTGTGSDAASGQSGAQGGRGGGGRGGRRGRGEGSSSGGGGASHTGVVRETRSSKRTRQK